MSETGQSSTVFVGGISWKANEDSLKQFFSTFGTVIDCKIIVDRETKKSKGYGFVTFNDPETAENVKKETNLSFLGKTMNVGDAVRKTDGAKHGSVTPVMNPFAYNYSFPGNFQSPVYYVPWSNDPSYPLYFGAYHPYGYDPAAMPVPSYGWPHNNYVPLEESSDIEIHLTTNTHNNNSNQTTEENGIHNGHHIDAVKENGNRFTDKRVINNKDQQVSSVTEQLSNFKL